MVRLRHAGLRYDVQQLAQFIFGQLIFRNIVQYVCRMRCRFTEPLPPGGFIIAANHRSFADPPVVGLWFDRPISYFARANLWRLPVIGFALRVFGGLPVERSAPQLAIMKQTVAWLRDGRRILMFPEGTRTRSGRLGELRDGVALFARRAGAPIVPVYLFRSERIWPLGWLVPTFGAVRAEIRFGPVLVAPAELSSREQDAWIMTRLRAWMHAQERELLGPPDE